MQTVKEISRISLLIKIPIPAITKKSQCANHAATGIRMTRTSYNDSQGIYTLEGRPKRGITYCTRDYK